MTRRIEAVGTLAPQTSHKEAGSGKPLDLRGCQLITFEGSFPGTEKMTLGSGGLISDGNGGITGFLKPSLFRFPGESRAEIWEGDVLPFRLRKEPLLSPDPYQLTSRDLSVGIEIEGAVFTRSGEGVDVNNSHVPYIPEALAGRRKELFAATTELAVEPATSYEQLVTILGKSMALETQHWQEQNLLVFWSGVLPHIPQLNGNQAYPVITDHPYVERMVAYLTQFAPAYQEARDFLEKMGIGPDSIEGIYLFFNQAIHAHCRLPTDEIDFAPFAMNFLGGAMADVKASLLASTPHWMGKIVNGVDCRWPSKSVLGTARYHLPYQPWETEKERILDLLGRGQVPAISRAWMPGGPLAQHGTDRLRPTLLTSEDMRPATHPVPEAVAAVAYLRAAEMWLAYWVWKNNGSVPPEFKKEAVRYFGTPWGGYPTEEIWVQNQRLLAEGGERAVVFDGREEGVEVNRLVSQYLSFLRQWTSGKVLSEADFEKCAEILLRLADPQAEVDMADYCNPQHPDFCRGSLGRIVRNEHLAKGAAHDPEVGWQVLTRYAETTSSALARFLE